jgi:hypothetical protein
LVVEVYQVIRGLGALPFNMNGFQLFTWVNIVNELYTTETLERTNSHSSTADFIHSTFHSRERIAHSLATRQ